LKIRTGEEGAKEDQCEEGSGEMRSGPVQGFRKGSGGGGKRGEAGRENEGKKNKPGGSGEKTNPVAETTEDKGIPGGAS